MEVIPVIDLKGGLVVRARMGERDKYQPIVTPLSPTSDPLDVAGGLLSLYPFASLYLADLDAIEGRGDNTATIDRLAAAFPDLVIWVDNGIAGQQAADTWLARGQGRLVIGSETQGDGSVARHFANNDRVALSLDYRGPSFQGPPELLSDPDTWPQRVIVMTLERVGSDAGPDLDRISRIRSIAPGRRIYAAGGVRGIDDLLKLKQADAAGALVASCLHDGRLSKRDLDQL
jgi:phosphoribosylformimino-5-aminoimidazole carboxamide ribotide isomerase